MEIKSDDGTSVQQSAGSTNEQLMLTKRHETITELIMQSKDSFYRMFINVYQEVKDINKSREYLYRDVQLQLRSIAVWSDEKVRYECARFKNMDEVSSLLGQIYELNQKLEGKHIRQDFKTQLFEKFVREVSLAIARDLWTKVYILYELVDCRLYDKQQAAFEKIITKNIKICSRKVTVDELATKVIQDMDIKVHDDVIHTIVEDEPVVAINDTKDEEDRRVEVDIVEKQLEVSDDVDVLEIKSEDTHTPVAPPNSESENDDSESDESDDDSESDLVGKKAHSDISISSSDTETESISSSSSSSSSSTRDDGMKHGQQRTRNMRNINEQYHRKLYDGSKTRTMLEKRGRHTLAHRFF